MDETLNGLSISQGIALGLAFHFIIPDELIPEQIISSQEIEQEIERYRKALEKSRKELEDLQKLVLQEGGLEAASILDTHLEMLKDPMITSEMEKKIRKNQKNTESVFQKVIGEYQRRFHDNHDAFFQERIPDITDVSKRILAHLTPSKKFDLKQIPKGSILYATELSPSLVAEIDPEQIIGLVTEAGGISSHAAIIARAKGIPYVAGVPIDKLKNRSPLKMIIDGDAGTIVLAPIEETWEKYERKSKKKQAYYQTLQKNADLQPHTMDGETIELYGNLENLEDIELFIKHGFAGIGLFRSEYLFFTKKYFPSEEEQFQIYKEVLEKLPNHPVIIRVFDVGGDKRLEGGKTGEANPVLGCRAIRFLLKNREIFEQQLRALLRASPYGDMRILLPMISDISEINATKELIAKIRKDLKKENIPCKDHIPLGSMIEVPSSAIMADVIAQHSDFLSIGTNDLIQYVLAADRSNPVISHLYTPSHPSILRLLKVIITAAEENQKSLILCGEVAADPRYIPLLLEVGIRKFSIAARHFPEVKHAIRGVNLKTKRL